MHIKVGRSAPSAMEIAHPRHLDADDDICYCLFVKTYGFCIPPPEMKFPKMLILIGFSTNL
jgi:hypothetical protein